MRNPVETRRESQCTSMAWTTSPTRSSKNGVSCPWLTRSPGPGQVQPTTQRQCRPSPRRQRTPRRLVPPMDSRVYRHCVWLRATKCRRCLPLRWHWSRLPKPQLWPVGLPKPQLWHCHLYTRRHCHRLVRPPICQARPLRLPTPALKRLRRTGRSKCRSGCLKINRQWFMKWCLNRPWSLNLQL